MQPLIKLFKLSNDDCYFYDANKNELVSITNIFYDYLQKYMKNESVALKAENVGQKKVFDDYKRRGYLSDHRPLIIEHPMSEYLDNILNNKIESITLQITQNCNLRCNYCPYTGNYYINRKHSNKKMNLEIAKKGVLFLAKHSTYRNEVNISFYGGEPLLEFEMISSIITYAKSIFSQKTIFFTITTNGTIMTEQIMYMLAKNEAHLIFSLDGSKEIHNANRKYIGGKGTYEDVIKNIKLLKQRYPEYFEKFVAINTVMDTKIDVMDIDEFYSTESLFQNIYVQTTITNPAYIREDIESIDVGLDEEKFIKYEFAKYVYLLHKLGRIKVNNSKIFNNYFEELLKTEGTLMPSKELPDIFHPSGPCIPGRKKLFMDVEGNFFPCERIDELSPVGRIGDINNGIEIDKVYKLLNIGKITENYCKNCWAISQCKGCFVYADDGHALSAEKRLKRCEEIKENIVEDFKDILFLKKYNYDFGFMKFDR